MCHNCAAGEPEDHIEPNPVEYLCREHGTWDRARTLTFQNRLEDGVLIEDATITHVCGIVEPLDRFEYPLHTAETGVESMAANVPRYWSYVESREVTDD